MDVHRTGGRHTFPLTAPAHFRRHLAAGRWDVIVEDLNKVPVYTPLWSRAPVVLLVHHLFGRTAFEEASLPVAGVTWLLERTVPALYRRLPVQAVSESTAQDLVERGFARERITVIENGVDLDFYSPSGEVARFADADHAVPGQAEAVQAGGPAIRALARLRADGCAARLIVAGQGDARGELERLSAELGVADGSSLRVS
jgi:hypothetical protein